MMKKLGSAIEWFVTGAAALGLLTFAVWLAAPRILGWSPQIVLSGSMEPTLPVGSVAFATAVKPEAVQVGDVITFRHPDNPNMLVTHRVVEVVPTDAGLTFKTRGDANATADQWVVRAEDVVGRVRWDVPYLGYVANRVHTPVGFIALIGLPAALLVVGELRSIVRQLRSHRTPGRGAT